MRLAIEAISVPRPPIFVPIISWGALFVNFEKSTAAGTLLIICEAAVETIRGDLDVTHFRKELISGIRPRFPMNI